jgi:hypothetical protein
MTSTNACREPNCLSRSSGYAVGSLGAVWTIQRTATLLGAVR